MEKEGASAKDIRRALYLAALSQFCIYTPVSEKGERIYWPLRKGDPLFNASIVKTTCTLSDFHSALRARDPLGKGFDSSYDALLQLIWGLLSWDPRKRLTASEALQHFYFNPPSNPDPYNPKSHSNDDTDNQMNNKNNSNTALESEFFTDPTLDINIEQQTIHDFHCPKCHRNFTDLHSCQQHVTGRRHGKFCSYDGSTLPPCLNAHSMLPAHPTYGYCDTQGRRRTIEDFHTIHLHETHQFYGVFDGHNGNLASKYVSSSLYRLLASRLKDVDDTLDDPDEYDDDYTDTAWKSKVTSDIVDSFRELHEGVLKAVESYPGVVMSQSGTTVTALFVTERTVIIANVGDSRAILSVAASYTPTTTTTGRSRATTPTTPIQLTVDHIASNKDERRRVEDLGGFVESKGGVDRLNGTLVLSRSIGDVHLAEYVSQTPHVIAMTKEEVRDQCRQQRQHHQASDEEDEPNDGLRLIDMPCFIVLASDGLWDVISNQEAVDMVELVIQKFDPNQGNEWEEGVAFQEAAEMLTKEAYARGSTDNIGVCVVAIE